MEAIAAAPAVCQNVMAVTAIRGVVSFPVGGLRDQHLTEATVVLGVVVPTAPGTTRTWRQGELDGRKPLLLNRNRGQFAR